MKKQKGRKAPEALQVPPESVHLITGLSIPWYTTCKKGILQEKKYSLSFKVQQYLNHFYLIFFLLFFKTFRDAFTFAIRCFRVFFFSTEKPNFPSSAPRA